MHSLNNRGVHSENLRIFPNYAPNKMDYRQKMVVPSSQKTKHEEEEDEDLEALRLAALKSLRGKNTLQSTQQLGLLPQPAKPRVASYPSCPVYGPQRTTKRGYYQNRPPRQNGNFYQPSRQNQNLIEIVPVEETEVLQKDASQNDLKTVKSDNRDNRDTEGDSKFYRYTDNASGSEEEDTKESNSTSTAALTSKSERLEKGEIEGDGSETEKDVQSGFEDSPREENAGDDVLGEEEDDEEDEDGDEEEDEDEEEEEEKPANDDDDDILLMADLEEEDSLERLMDEMEREMNSDKPIEKKEKKSMKKDTRELTKSNDVQKPRARKSRTDPQTEKNGISSSTGQISSSSISSKTSNDLRSNSPRPAIRTQQKRRSLSPKPRPRKKSPRRSPRRSPPRQSKKLSREMPRMRSPRKLSPPSRFSPRSPKMSPRPRSPRLSPRRSPNRSPVRRSPMRKMSPRGRSPRSRSPRVRRSRSPRPISRSRSPRPLRSPKRLNRSRSPRIGRSRSPRASPVRMSPRARSPLRTRSPPRARSPIRTRSPPRARSPPRTKSPRASPHRLSPLRRASPRTRSPRLSPRRAMSPRPRSPKMSPERRRASPGRLRSPARLSPHRSPWTSPRNSPRLSPRRRRSPKEPSRKNRPRSLTPEEKSSGGYKREASPQRKTAASPDAGRSKPKQTSVSSGPKDSSETSNDPVLEARRRKFECTKLIDPINDNKKIKLSKKETASKKVETPEEPELPESPKSRKSCDVVEEDYEMTESDLCLNEDYVYEVLEDVASDASSGNEAVAMCIEMPPVKPEKVRSKKKKKRDKELYQVGKLKGELPLSERIGKEKKCKKRKDRTSSPVESSPEPATPAAVEDLTVDEEGDLRTELSRRRAERLNRAAPIQSARLLQSAFKGVVKEVAKTNAKVIQRNAVKGEEKNSKKEVRRVTVLHRPVTDLPDSEEETVADSKVPVRFRLGLNKPAAQDSREPKAARKSSKRQGRKVKHKNNMSLTDHERKKQ